MKLILLTANFPYHPGEQFLEGEIGILAKSFEKVLIIPLSLSIASNNLSPRPVPENVEVLFLPQDLSRRYKIQMALQVARLSRTLKDLIIAAVHGRIFLPSKLQGLCVQYFTAALLSSLIFILLCRMLVCRQFYDLPGEHYERSILYWPSCKNTARRKRSINQMRLAVFPSYRYIRRNLGLVFRGKFQWI